MTDDTTDGRPAAAPSDEPKKPNWFSSRENQLTVLAGLALVFSSASLAASFGPGFDARVRGYLLANPQVIEEAVQRLGQQRQAEEATRLSATIEQNRQALYADPRDPFIGRADAPIVVVEFFDYNCGYCKSVVGDLNRLVQTQTDVKVVLKELPILAQSSVYAAQRSLGAHKLGADYGALHTDLMNQRALDEATVDRVLAQRGVDTARAAAIADSPEVVDHLSDVSRLASALGVNGTPAFFVGTTAINGADMAALQAAIDAERSKLAGRGDRR